MEHDFIIINSDDELIDGDNPLTKLLKSSKGRSKLAQSMVAPMRRQLNYAGIARKVLVIDPLPDAVLPTYIKADRVTVPTFELLSSPSSPSITITNIRQRRFNITGHITPRHYYEMVVISSSDNLESSNVST